MKIAVLGAGAWGTAMASHAARRHDVVLWCRDGEQARDMQASRVNSRYLPGVALDPGVRVLSDLASALDHGQEGLWVVATPMSALRAQLSGLRAAGVAVWLCKGLEAPSGLMGHELAAQLRPQLEVGVLSGPTFAQEVANRQPSAAVVASSSAQVRERAVEAFHDEAMRIYTSQDITGVEVGGALKNVLAIAAGILDGLAPQQGLTPGLPGLNARAALITRGLAEMTRFGVSLGAQASTFMGLSGLGDLVLTATGSLSRNRQLGLLLAQGVSAPKALAQLGHVAEGAYAAPTVLSRARSLGLDMPITEAVVGVIEGRLSPQQAMIHLMSREARAEA
jgi:glycerol-3-phosphate dehydrogenase (NAD(P)+)